LKRFTVLDNRPSLVDMETKFRRTKLIACVGSTALTLAMIPVWPLITLADGVMDLGAFKRWVRCRFHSLNRSHLASSVVNKDCDFPLS